MTNVVDLGDIGSLGSKVVGTAPHFLTGSSVAPAGDVNGDGIDDVIIGSRTRSYVIFGQEGGIEDIDLANLQASEGFEIGSDLTDLVVGRSVSSAGDINGDGFDDLMVGGFQYLADDFASAPTAFVIFGKPEFEDINLSDFFESATTDGFRIFDDFLLDDFLGARVASAGDFNGDGLDDMVVGTPGSDRTGAAYVIFGKTSDYDNIDLANLAPGAGLKITGAAFLDQLGFSVSGAGDVNGDGYDDIILGARYGDSGGSDAGQAYVIFGREMGLDTIDISNLDAESGFMLRGGGVGESAGWSVSAAGDVNGDGFDDVIIGAPYARGPGKDATVGAGEAYVVFGKAGVFGTVDLSTLKPNDGFTIKGEVGDLAGWSVSGAGDLNSDGFDDIIVGAPGADGAGEDAGEAYVIFGRAHGLNTIDLGRLADGRGRSDGLVLQGVNYDRAGTSVAGAGDFDADGVDDLIIGAPSPPRIDAPVVAGKAYILSGAELAEFWDPVGGQGQDHRHFPSDLLW
jgi:hypothetical protein